MLVCKYVRLTRLGVGWGVGEKHVIDVEDEDEVNSYHANNLDALHGADLVVCDEGHRIKNRDAIISMVLKEVKTRRRLVLTGYPLQNNLEEYWCMVDFVRPAFLGSISEFNNMFTQPILNGQCVDSRPVQFLPCLLQSRPCDPPHWPRPIDHAPIDCTPIDHALIDHAPIDGAPHCPPPVDSATASAALCDLARTLNS
eukprot:m.389449 g.389449  ORF g.389449 m.389449 type:complete len:198 (-) comp21050_c0_seq9:5-598(-)